MTEIIDADARANANAAGGCTAGCETEITRAEPPHPEFVELDVFIDGTCEKLLWRDPDDPHQQFLRVDYADVVDLTEEI